MVAAAALARRPCDDAWDGGDAVQAALAAVGTGRPAPVKPKDDGTGGKGAKGGAKKASKHTHRQMYAYLRIFAFSKLNPGHALVLTATAYPQHACFQAL